MIRMKNPIILTVIMQEHEENMVSKANCPKTFHFVSNIYAVPKHHTRCYRSKNCQAPVAHAYNPKCLVGWDE
jgi:hypothetical protein